MTAGLVWAGTVGILVVVGLISHARASALLAAATRAAGPSGIDGKTLGTLGGWDALASVCLIAAFILGGIGVFLWLIRRLT